MAGPKPIKDPHTGIYKADFYTTEGRRVRQSLRTAEKSIASPKLKILYKEECERDLFAKPEGTLFIEAADAYVAATDNKRFLEKLVMEYGPSLTIEQIDDVRMIQAAESILPGRSPATWQRQVITPTKAVIRFGQGKRRRPRTDKVRTRWLTPEEAERLLTACSDAPTRAKIAFLLGSGCRTGEMFALEMTHFWPTTGEALVLGKNGEERMIKLPTKAMEMVRPALTWPTGRVFRTPKGHGYVLRENGGGQMAEAFNKARDAAGLGTDVTPHVCRHTFATWFYAQTRDLFRLMALGGWKRPEMAQRYTKIAPADLAEQLYDYGWEFVDRERGLGRILDKAGNENV